MMELPRYVSLVAIDREVPVDEIRRWWNLKDTPVLDDVAAGGPRLRLGLSVDGYWENITGPSFRVYALLFLRGTLPEYVVPRLDDELIHEILIAYQWQENDSSGTQLADLEEVATFLAIHRGGGILAVEDQEP